jgi:hypothetical protein
MNVATPYDDLALTTVMSPVILVTGSVALALFITFVICETFRLQYQAVRAAVDTGGGEAPKIGPFLLRAFTILTSLVFLYQWVFLKMLSLCDHIFLLFNNEDAWMSLIGQLSQSDTSVRILSSNIPTLLGATAISLLQVVQDLFLAFRFVVLAILYVSGPIVWVFGVSEIGLRSITGWFKNTWQVCFWIVVFGIVKSTVVPLGLYALGNGVAGVTAGLVYAIVIIMMIIAIPKLTGALFSDEHISALGNSIGGAAVAYYASAHSNVRDGVHGAAGGALPPAAGALGRTIGGYTNTIMKKMGYASPPPSGTNSGEGASSNDERTR